jgi:hypothetical protein
LLKGFYWKTLPWSKGQFYSSPVGIPAAWAGATEVEVTSLFSVRNRQGNDGEMKIAGSLNSFNFGDDVAQPGSGAASVPFSMPAADGQLGGHTFVWNTQFGSKAMMMVTVYREGSGVDAFDGDVYLLGIRLTPKFD